MLQKHWYIKWWQGIDQKNLFKVACLRVWVLRKRSFTQSDTSWKSLHKAVLFYMSPCLAVAEIYLLDLDDRSILSALFLEIITHLQLIF